MFLERFAVYTLKVRAQLLNFFNFLLRETDSQLGQIFFTCCLFFLTALLFFAWTHPYALWLQISFTLIYLISSLFCVSGIYFILKRKRVRISSNSMEVYTLNEPGLEKFQDLKLTSIPLSEVQANAIFNEFSENYLHGNYQSFQSLILLKPISYRNRLIWKDLSPKRPQQVNRQTLLEFLSQLLIGFENLENHQMILFVEHYFSLKNTKAIEQRVSTKNISSWRNNDAPYLKKISRLFQKHL